MGKLLDYLAENDSNFRRARIPALYSDFRSQKRLNPDGYRANVSAWRSALTRLTSSGLLTHQGRVPSIFFTDVDDGLLRALEDRRCGQPLSLGIAVREAIADKDFLPLSDFMNAPQSIYASSWTRLPFALLGWTLQQLSVTDALRAEDKLPTGRYVVKENLESASKKIFSGFAERTSRFDRVLTRSQFRSFSFLHLDAENTPRLSDTDLDILLKFLSRDKSLIEYKGQTIRLRKEGDPSMITEEDDAIAMIKELSESLERQVMLLSHRIEELTRDASEAVASKNRIAALAALRSKKLAESSLTSHYATLNRLEEVASKIEQASDQVQIAKVMELSANVLQSLNQQVGGVGTVEHVMDRLREQMDDTNEVSAILAESAGPAVDEGEIDEELEALEEEKRVESEEIHRKEEERKAEDEAAKVQQELDRLPPPPKLELPYRHGAQTPNTEAGVARGSLEEQNL